MVEITITIPAAAYEWYDQIVESYGGIYDNVQDYISCQVSGRWREATSAGREGGFIYADYGNNKNGSGSNGSVL